jgi:hypothetical protein
MENHITPACAHFIADYVNDQIMRGKTIDKFTIMGGLSPTMVAVYVTTMTAMELYELERCGYRV